MSRPIQLDAADLAALRDHEQRWHEEAGREPVVLATWHWLHRETVDSEVRDDGTLVETLEDGAVRCTRAVR